MPDRKPRRRSESVTRDSVGCFVILLVVGAIGFFLIRNIQPSVRVALPASTPTATPIDNTWQQAIENALIEGATIIPTIDPRSLPTAYVAPTLPPLGTPFLVPPTDLFVAA